MRKRRLLLGLLDGLMYSSKLKWPTPPPKIINKSGRLFSVGETLSRKFRENIIMNESAIAMLMNPQSSPHISFEFSLL